jgi:hypothetical protein
MECSNNIFYTCSMDPQVKEDKLTRKIYLPYGVNPNKTRWYRDGNRKISLSKQQMTEYHYQTISEQAV